jgi:Bacterial Ig-like domain (group 1)
VNAADSADQQSIITAIVRDPNNNPVKNQTVSFSLTDVSGGRISPASAITDSFGRASTVYTAGPTPSAQDGVVIDARVADATDRVTLTVAQQAFFITLGTGNTITEPNSTSYLYPYQVLVTDVNSNPVSGVKVELSLFPIQYRKGFYVPLLDKETDGFIRWTPKVRITCPNEDNNRNGILEEEKGEDVNENGRLDPGNVATVPTFVTTGSDGIAHFDIDYPQDHANWATVELEARTAVVGSESSAKATFILPIVDADVSNEDIIPPGVDSPFGTVADCSDPN